MDPATQAIVNAFTNPPTAARQTAMDNMVVALKNSGAWTLFDRLYVMAAADSQAASINWINPGTDSLTTSGTIEFHPDRGYRDTGGGTGFASNGTNFSALTQFQQNNAHIAMWNRGIHNADRGSVQFGEDSAFKISINPGGGGALNSAFASVNMPAPTGYTTGNWQFKGFSMLTRSDATNVTAYWNDQNTVTAAASAAPTAAPMKACIGAQTLIGMMSCGADLASQAAAYYSAVLAYMQAVGNDNNFSGEWSFDFRTNPTIKSPEGFILDSYFPAQLTFDWEGVPRFTLEHEVPFVGYRRVRNLLTATATLATQTATVVSGRSLVLSFTGAGSITYSGAVAGTLSGQGANKRVATGVLTAGTTSLVCTVSGDVRLAQLEDVTWQSNQNPGEYVSVGSTVWPYQGTTIDGVQYFTTQNGNTVSGGVVTAGAGAALWAKIKGIYHFNGDFNRCLFSEDTANAGWTKTGTAPTIVTASDNCGPVSLDTINDNGAAALEGIEQSIAWDVTDDGADGSCKGVSMIVKQGTSTSSLVWVRDTTNNADRLVATITWSSGVPVLTASVGFVDTINDGTHGAGVEQLTNSCWRVSFTTAASIVIDGTATNRLGFYPAATGTADTASTGTIKVGGFQAANHPRVGPYQKTTAAATVRNNPMLFDARYGGLPWFNNTEGTFTEEWINERLGITTTAPIEYYLHEAVKWNQHPTWRQMLVGNESLTLDDLVYTGAGNQTDTNNTPGVVQGSVMNIAAAYKANDCAYAVNSTLVKQYSSVTLPSATYTPDLFSFSSGISGIPYGKNGNFADLKGYIRKAAYYQTRKPNATLLTLSTETSPTPTPTPTPSSGLVETSSGGGGYGRTFGYYPAENPQVLAYKKKINRKVTKRRRLEQRMSFAMSGDELQALLAKLNAVQKQIDGMVQTYEHMLVAARRRRTLKEDEEVLSLIV